MKRTNWSNVEKSAKQTKRNVKNMQGSTIFFKNFPEKGHMTDVVDAYQLTETGEVYKDANGKKVKLGKTAKDIIIKDAPSSTLRRLVKSLDNYYYLITDEKSKQKILDKKVEIETELNSRDDGLKK